MTVGYHLRVRSQTQVLSEQQSLGISPVPVWHLLKVITAAVHGGRPRTPTLRRLESEDTLNKLARYCLKNRWFMARCAGMCCNPSTLEPEASRSHRAQGQPGKHSEFQTRLCYVVRPCLKKRREGWRGAGKGREKKSFHASKYCFRTPRYRSHSDYGPEHYLSPPSLSVGERAKD